MTIGLSTFIVQTFCESAPLDQVVKLFESTVLAVGHPSPYRLTPPRFCAARRTDHAHAQSACCPASPDLPAATGNGRHSLHTPRRHDPLQNPRSVNHPRNKRGAAGPLVGRWRVTT